MKINTRFATVIVTAMLATVGASFAYAEAPVVDAAKVKEYNKKNKEKGAHWEAKETWVSKLSQKNLQRMFGNNALPTQKLDYSVVRKPNVPASIDWRNQNGVNWLGPIMNQGDCGSCVAFSTVATLEAQVSISAGLPWLHPTFSADQLFECGGGSCDSGWEPGGAADFLKKTGIVDMACQPDNMGSTGNDISCSQATSCADASSRTYKIAGSTSPSGGIFGGGNAAAVEAALAKGPLVTTLTVYTDFLTYSSGIYKHVSGKAEGGHAVSIVGYNATERYWIVRNSWGPTWGENGFIRVSFDDDSGVASDTWQFQLPAKSEFLSVTSPTENDYVSGTIRTTVALNGTGTTTVDVRKSGSTEALSSLPCTMSGSSGCVATLNTTTLPDGRYEMIARTSETNVFSQVRSFYVVNHVPTNLAISYTGNKISLTKTLTDRVEFAVKTTSSSVPFQSVSIMVRQNGQIVSQRETDTVLSSMVIGFRTNTVPNGSYDVFFRGVLPAAGKLLTVDSNVATLNFKN
jgi:C1A family cysteine protease